MALLLLIALLVLIAVMVSLVGRRRDEIRAVPVDDAVTSLARELEAWLEEGDHDEPLPHDDAVVAPEATPARVEEHRVLSLADLLEPVQFPEDLLPLTHGMNPADLHFRLVLYTMQAPGSVRQWLDTELVQAGFDLRWDDDVLGTARRREGAVRVQLHLPMTEEQIRASLPPEPRRRRKREPVLKRPDFPSAPFGATIIELRLQP